MRICKKIFKVFYALFAVLVLALTATAGFYGDNIDDTYKITKGSRFGFDTLMPVTAQYNGVVLSECEEINTVGSSFQVEVKLFGIIPVKSTTVEVVEESYVAVLGTPFGIKMYTDGVLVVDMQEIETLDGKKSPAKEAGIKIGDYIISVDGEKVSSNEDLGRIFSSGNGEEMSVELRRNSVKHIVRLTPVLSKEDSSYKAGIWVKDSSAGIGTLTFYCPYNNMICGLGHGIYDSDTKEVIDFSRGSLVGADILSIVKGTKGVPGELKGRLSYSSVATLSANLINGVYGQATCNVDTKNLTQIAHKQDVKNGPATIISTVDSNGPKAYTCEIKVNTNKVNDTVQDMTVTVTDKALVEKTGGIVQGMSGSPIIQNGKLVGAVTHVLIDDPTKGYGIFAENMLETAQSVADEQLKEAS
ncbi:MAG: SpoIVB peptidase [Acutalibacteraceae bacterium]|nr:SpoIVB peptidase [Acutalibacteraceae bacterium]